MVVADGAIERLLRAKRLIDDQYFQPLDVVRLAEVAGLSQAHFSRSFHQAFGSPPHQYVLARRMERAALMLSRTDQQVKDVCVSVGFHSVGSFTTRFGREFGVSPTTYRKTHRR